MKKVILFLVCCTGLFAGSIRLYNDSPYKLRAVIRGADGTYLGEMVILPEHFNTWSDFYSSFGPGGQQYTESPNRTLTPYTVYWYCLDGDAYGIVTNVATGSAVLAESAEGLKMCKPSKKKGKSPYGPHEDDEQLHQQNEAKAP
ncbi:MAG: hypothetical protein K1000chlam2_01013 [Chlamydiae bacterium]|nr:hypothetical protein [Chlamydiota bacterium]